MRASCPECGFAYTLNDPRIVQVVLDGKLLAERVFLDMRRETGEEE